MKVYCQNTTLFPRDPFSPRVCCGATAEVATNRVAAGTNTTLRVTLALAGKQGQVEKAIYVMSNDPVAPVFRLSIMAAVPATVTSGGHK